MKSLEWRRDRLIGPIRRHVWRYLTAASTVEAELEATALLQMRAGELRTLGAAQFLLSDELGALLDEVPRLLRRLATTTTNEEEWSADRVRGAIQWSRTLGARQSTGISHLYVTAPSRRAFQTPENELLVFLLDQTRQLGGSLGWYRSQSRDTGRIVAARIAASERWSQSRMLASVERKVVSPRAYARVRSGRFRRRYATVIDAYERYRALVGSLDREVIRHAVETAGLVSRDDATLFELYCTFAVLGALQEQGWTLGRFGLFRGSLRLTATRGAETMRIDYQQVPRSLGSHSRYREIQHDHRLGIGALRPDLVLNYDNGADTRWLLVEAKGGERSVDRSARAAIFDLLAYRSAFAPALVSSPWPYGLGVAWGAGLFPARGENTGIVLSTPDTIGRALLSVFPALG
jgi:hypothetical protein